MPAQNVLDSINELVNEAKRCNQRRLIVIADERDKGIELLREILKKVSLEKMITFTKNRDFNVPGEIEELKNSDKYLGTNYDLLAMDLHHSFIPNDLGKLINIVRGGGLIILLTPPFEKWPDTRNFFHEVILTPPYTMEDIKGNFARWVIKKLREHKGITIIEGGKIEKLGSLECNSESKRIDIPQKTRFPREAYEMCMSQDQVRTLQVIERLGKKGVIIITADRGRGKSSILGIAAGLFSKRFRKIGITAPEFSNVREIFRFFEITARIMDLKFKRKWHSIAGKNFKIEFVEPANIDPRNYDLLIVDESAGIPVPLLLKYLRAKRVIYSTTVHGYEGTGRAFSIRFLEEVKKRVKNLALVEMNEPIRYARNDPVERWLFDTLLLDSEPPKIEKIDTDKLQYKRYTIEELLEQEDKLREYYGIFVLAHYRNNPNDFGILCDAPNHEIRVLEYNGHVVCSVQLAREGKIEKQADDLYYGTTPPGNIVPDVLIKHHRMKDFAKYEGFRIVRIATHPEFMDMGIGSLMLNNIKREKADWIGSSFGATERLLRFWIKNDFYPIHISPKLNESTGEYSVVIIHPKNEVIRDKIKRAREIFGERLIISLGEIHKNMEPEIVRDLLNTIPKERDLDLTPTDWKRLIVYSWGPGNYETMIDVIYKISSMYFFLNTRPKLNKEQEIILIAKVLQHRHWDKVGKLIGKGGTYVVIELREIMRKFIGGTYDEEVSEFQRRFHGENQKR